MATQQVFTPNATEYAPVVLTSPWVLIMGDSKTATGWVPLLPPLLNAKTGQVWGAVERGVGGKTVAATLADIQYRLSIPSPSQVSRRATPIAGPVATAPQGVLINLGVNDSWFVLPNQATWQASYLSLIDTLRLHWANIPIYLARPWLRFPNGGAGAAGDMDTIATWIATIVGLRSNLFVGPDERVWLKGADDGAAMTSDGIHYSSAGNVACAAQWQAVFRP